MTKLFYFLKRFGYNALPSSYFKKKYAHLKFVEKNTDHNLINHRLNYYCKLNSPFPIPSEAITVSNFKRDGHTEYFLDLKEFLHYFSPSMAFVYQFGDDTHINDYPTLFKARPIEGENSNSILFKLNKRRHFNWANDSIAFKDKHNLAVWRGGSYLSQRKDFVHKLWQHPLCNIGQTNKPNESVPWQKPYMSMEEQLKYKYIFCIEGNDVATNLKWVLSSNSLCIMPRPTKETWFMEGKLKAGVHYVELNKDYSNLEELINYYNANPKEAKKITRAANEFTAQFKSKDIEDLLCLKVLEKYAELSMQTEALRFK